MGVKLIKPNPAHISHHNQKKKNITYIIIIFLFDLIYFFHITINVYDFFLLISGKIQYDLLVTGFIRFIIILLCIFTANVYGFNEKFQFNFTYF